MTEKNVTDIAELENINISEEEYLAYIRDAMNFLEGKHDDIPESAFLFVGGIDEVVAKAKGDKA